MKRLHAFVTLYAVAALTALAVAPMLARTDLSANVVAAWELESNGADSAGANTLTVNNAPSFVAAKQGNGVDLELGSTQHLSIADNAALSLGSDTPFTSSTWFKIESFGADAFIMSKTGDYLLKLNYSSNEVWFGVIDGTAYNAHAEFAAPSLATWYHACGRHDASGNLVTLRVNGGSTNTEATNPNGSQDGSGAFNIGADNNTNHFDGVVDQQILWKAHLSDANCDELYGSGAGVTLASIGIGGGGGGASTPRMLLLGIGEKYAALFQYDLLRSQHREKSVSRNLRDRRLARSLRVRARETRSGGGLGRDTESSPALAHP